MIAESMDVVEYVDEMYPDQSPLQPADPKVKAQMETFIDRYDSLPGSFYNLYMHDAAQQKSLAETNDHP